MRFERIPARLDGPVRSFLRRSRSSSRPSGTRTAPTLAEVAEELPFAYERSGSSRSSRSPTIRAVAPQIVWSPTW